MTGAATFAPHFRPRARLLHSPPFPETTHHAPSAAFRLLLAGSLTPVRAQDAAEFVVRLNRIEGQMRQMSGQIEQLQFENRQLKDQLRRFQEDTEFRFQEGRGPAPRAQAPAAAPPPSRLSGRSPSRAPVRRSDAFDPSAQPGAPGAPRPLGTSSGAAPPSGVASGEPTPPRGTQADAGRSIEDIIDDEPPRGAGPLDLNPAAQPPTAPRPSVAATGSRDPRADYDAAYAYILQRQYEQAEMGFRQFLQSHPRDKLVPDAVFWLGESYLARSRPREAAEQFLKISTDFSRSGKAPDAMLKLGVSLNALGARDQACATFAELERKFPQAAPNLRQGLEREQRRAKCMA
jgi:tol-pal system protein YbgF